MSIPLDAGARIAQDPSSEERLRRQFGGSREVDRDGSVYSSIGDRPIPPPKALRKIHADRQAEIKERLEAKEAEEAMLEYGMHVKDDHLRLNFGDVRTEESIRLRQKLAHELMEARLCDTAHEYFVQGSGLAECGGRFAYSTDFCQGAPVYRNDQGWTLHRDRPPIESSIGTNNLVSEFGWLITKEGRPFYAARTDAMMAPESGWEVFLGPPPAPSKVSRTSWEQHFTGKCGALKDAGNAAMKSSLYTEAHSLYSGAIGALDGYDSIIATSTQLRELSVALHANRAEARLRLERWQDAVADCHVVLGSQPAHAKAAVRLSRALRALGRAGEAVDPLRRAIQDAASQTKAELRSVLEECDVLASCESGASALASVHRGIRRVKDELSAAHMDDGEGVGKVVSGLARSVEELGSGMSDSRPSQQASALLRATGLLDLATATISEVEDRDAGGAEADWAIDLIDVCTRLAGESELRRILLALPAATPRLVARPSSTLRFVRTMLGHYLRQRLHVADAIIATKGLLAGCLRHWVQLLSGRRGEMPSDSCDDDGDCDDPCDVLLALGAQATRLDTVQALSLALFVECFVGQKFEKEDGTIAVTGGFVLYAGSRARRCVLSLLRQWASDDRALASLSAQLVGRLWLAVATKLRRDSNLEVEKKIPSPPGASRSLRLEWFKLKSTQALRKNVGIFYPEDLLEPLLCFMRAHVHACCLRGSSSSAASIEGLAPRHPAEEWLDDAVDRPFGWGILLPLVAAPPPTSVAALALLEEVIDQYPHNEKLAKKLAGLHAFMPLLGLPWPSGPNAASCDLGSTLAAGPSARRGAAKLLRCAIDTEIALRVAEDHPKRCVDACASLLTGLLSDGDEPEAACATVEAFGILVGNLDCWEHVPEEMIVSVVRRFVSGMGVPDAALKSQLGKLLRLALANAGARHFVQKSFEDESLGLSDEQRERVIQEIYDVRTLAGQRKAELTLAAREKAERTPAMIPEGKAGSELGKRLEELVAKLDEHFLRRAGDARVLVLGRSARALAKAFNVVKSCQVVLGETSFDKLNADDFGPNVVPLLLPLPKVVARDSVLASSRLFDLVIASDPLGYLDVAEYAEHLRDFIRRRETNEEREQIQWICVELQERLDDARDELFSAGYYNGDNDAVVALEEFRRIARKLHRGIAFFSLPSEEKERRRRFETDKAIQRRARKDREDEARVVREEEEERRRGVLHETLFDPLLSVPEVSSLPVAYELGTPVGDEDVLLIWLPGNGVDPAEGRPALEAAATAANAAPGKRKLRIIVVGWPSEEGPREWFAWSDGQAVGLGTEWFEMAGGPCKEDVERAAKDPAANVSFGKPSLEELLGLKQLEVGCKQLLNLAEEQAALQRPVAKIAFGGFAQGGAVATYAALGGLASEELKSKLFGIVVCCTGIPVLHFLAPRLQASCLAAREERLRLSADDAARASHLSLPAVHLVYGRGDAEVNENFVETARDMFRRFEYPVKLRRFEPALGERFPQVSRREVLSAVVGALTT